MGSPRQSDHFDGSIAVGRPLHIVRVFTDHAHALLTRLDRLQPFALHMPMVPAAIPSEAQHAIDRYLLRKQKELKTQVNDFLQWLNGPRAGTAPPEFIQRRYTILRLKFNAVLGQFDIFADAMTQRSEHATGVWLAGLDKIAMDALKINADNFNRPALITYLDRGMSAAIRRARTRLPGGGENPVAIVRVPRERMIGSSVASSLIHEVGHQGAALLNLVNSMQSALGSVSAANDGEQRIWALWRRWISEIIADFWSIARIGIASTMGLMGVVSLPRAFVFRMKLDDPHPIPWIRVKLSCALGEALYPHPQWRQCSDLWQTLYPMRFINAEKRKILNQLLTIMPAFVQWFVEHRPAGLNGKSIRSAMNVENLQPHQLDDYFDQWRSTPRRMRQAAPTLVIAVLGRAKFDGRISPREESHLLGDLLRRWAFNSHENGSMHSLQGIKRRYA